MGVEGSIKALGEIDDQLVCDLGHCAVPSRFPIVSEQRPYSSSMLFQIEGCVRFLAAAIRADCYTGFDHGFLSNKEGVIIRYRVSVEFHADKPRRAAEMFCPARF